MPPNPVQAAASWAGLPLTGAFTRDFSPQTTVPVDGSAPSGRVYSPFVLRVLLPDILGDSDQNVLVAGRDPLPGPRAPSEGAPEVRTTRRGSPAYSRAVRGVSAPPPTATNYEALTSLGGSLPGISGTSVGALEQAYNQARFDQLNGERVARAVRGRGARPGAPRPISPARTGELAALNLLLQIKQIASVPPLLLLINPASFTVSYTKVAQYQERTRFGFIYQSWGEEPAKISMSFRIGAYYSGKGSTPGAGMSRAARNDSAAYQQLMALLTFYQSGGYLQPTDGSRAYPMIGNLAIEYDQKVYVGHMGSFSFSEEETNANGGIQAEVEFTAAREFDLAGVPGQVGPMINPNGDAGNPRGTLSRSGSRGSFQVFSAPSVELPESTPPRAWAAPEPESSPPPQPVTTRRR